MSRSRIADRITRLLPPSRAAKALVLSDLATTTGTGLFLTGGVLFLVRAAGFSPAQVAIGLTAGGAIGLTASVPLGRLADDLGPREVTMALLGLRAVATAAFLLVRSLPALIVVAALVLAFERGGAATFGALTARVGGAQRVRLQAYLRTVTNIGVSVGAALAGVFIASNSPAGYVWLILADSAGLLIGALLLLGAGPTPRRQRSARGRGGWTALRDRTYLMFSGLHALLSLNYEVLGFALPLWIVVHTGAPAWLVSVLVVTNTGLVVLFQIPASRGVDDPVKAARVGRRAGLVFLVSCALIATSAGRPATVAVVLLVCAVLVHTLGELWQAAASFALSFDLAREDMHGQYQSVYALGEGVERALAPSILGVLCITWGAAGWLVLGALFTAGGLALPSVVRRRARAGEDHGHVVR